MRLGIKLQLSFFAVLTLSALVALAGWKGMNAMELQTRQTTAISTGVNNVLWAEASMRRYLMYENDADAQLTRKRLDTAEQEFKNAQTLMRGTGETGSTSVAPLLEDVTLYREKFNALAQLTENKMRLAKIMEQEGLAITEGLDEILFALFDASQNKLDHEIFLGFKKISDVSVSFYSSRADTLQFTSNPNRELQERATLSIEAVAGNMEYNVQYVKTQEDKKLVLSCAEHMEVYRKAFKEYVSTINKRLATQQELRQQILQAVENADRLTVQTHAEALTIQSEAQRMLWGALLIALILGGGISFVLSNGVLKQLGKDPNELAAIARRVSEGDFAIDDGSRKIGVYANIVSMVAALKENMDKAQRESLHAQSESVRAQEATREADAARMAAERAKKDGMLTAAVQLEGSVTVLSHAAEQLSAQIEQSGKGSLTQSARMMETATAMEEMNATVLEVAKSASLAAEDSGHTREQAEEGAEIVRKVVAAVDYVQKQTSALKGDMAVLGEHAQSVSQIMGVISDIADQTNLLALNAAIEAARAGDAGRGFAVVADEVRKLAEKTMHATIDVANAIKSIQASTEASIQQVDNSVNIINGVTELANESGAALEKIVGMVDATVDQVRSIATASEEQSAASEEINQSIIEVNRIASESAQTMQDARLAVEEMVRQTESLGHLISEMKRV